MSTDNPTPSADALDASPSAVNRRRLLALAASFSLVACGGGSGSDSPAAVPPPPAGSPPAGSPPAGSPPPPAEPPASGPATPVPPRTKSAKRGIAYDLKDTADIVALAPGVSWFYNWSPRTAVTAAVTTANAMDFQPMLWNGDFNDAQIIASLKATPAVKYLLLLNEPNLVDQSNLTPAAAAALWPRYEAIAASTGVKLVGPQITYGTMPDYGDPVVWLDAFYAAYRAANGNRDPHIDHLGFHWYDYGLDDQLTRLEKYGKPFWVTEFANWHSGNGPHIDSMAKQKAQMTDMVATCERRADVVRYAWFTGRWDDQPPRYTNLLGASGQLTELGQHYMTLPYTA